METEYGLYINGHGTTDPDTLCFIPSIFNEITMAENYGKQLVNDVCNYNYVPVYALLNNPSISFIGNKLSKHRKTGILEANYFEYNKTNIVLCNDETSRELLKSLIDTEFHNLFDLQRSAHMTSNEIEIIDYLRQLKVVFTGVSVPPVIFVPMLDNKGIPLDIKIPIIFEYTANKNNDFKGPSLVDYNPSVNNTIKKKHIKLLTNNLSFKLAEAALLEFYKIMKLPIEDETNILINFSNPHTIIKFAKQLLKDKVIFMHVPNDTFDLFAALEANHYKFKLSQILNLLKRELIESRLNNPLDTKFKLKCIACRSISNQAKRKVSYKKMKDNIPNIFDVSKESRVPKSIKMYKQANLAINITNVAMEGFQGFISPNITIHNIILPCFLYAMYTDNEHTVNLKSTYIDLINGFLNYELQKSDALTLSYELDSKTLTLIINSLVAQFADLESPEQIIENMFSVAFETLTRTFAYKVEDVIIIFGKIIKEFNTYIDIPSGVFRTFSNISPHEYEKANIPSSANVSYKRPNTNKPGKRTHKKLNLPMRSLKPSADKPLTNEDIIHIAIHLLSSRKYPFLSPMIESDPDKYIPVLFDMLE